MRIASLSPAVTEILFALGLSDRIVCTDRFSNFPEGAKAIAHLSDHQKIAPTAVAACSPEVVFTSTVIQQRLSEELRAAGMSCIHFDPRTVHGVYESIRQVGMLLGAERQAGELVLRMQQGFNDVRKKSALLPSRPRVYIEEWHDPPYASGNWVPEVARIAGGQQFPVTAGELSRQVSLEEVAAFDPDMIVISWCGAGALADPALLTGRPGWNALRAVAAGQVRVIDDSLLNRPGPRLTEGAQRLYAWLFQMLH